MKIPILYEDSDLVVVEKPAGVLAYPLPGSDEKTVGDYTKAMPCHRLDRDTSGVMVLAKNKKAKEAMQKLFTERKVKKIYTALVWGKVEPKEGEIAIPLGRGAKDRLRVVPSASGRASNTLYKVQRHYPGSNMSLLSVDLKTGRTHQIRVHFSAIGHPVVGDKKYSKRASEGLNRQFLHASEISFNHPTNGKPVDVKSKTPENLASFLKKLY